MCVLARKCVQSRSGPELVLVRGFKLTLGNVRVPTRSKWQRHSVNFIVKIMDTMEKTKKNLEQNNNLFNYRHFNSKWCESNYLSKFLTFYLKNDSFFIITYFCSRFRFWIFNCEAISWRPFTAKGKRRNNNKRRAIFLFVWRQIIVLFILTSKQVLPMLFPGRNQSFDPKTTFSDTNGTK